MDEQGVDGCPNNRLRWFASAERRRSIQAFFAEQPHLRQAVLHDADRLCQDQLRLLGHGYLPFSHPARWHFDPVLKIAAPRRFYGSIDYLDAQQVGDSKHVWEPSRFGWCYTLGMAYRISGDRRYADKFRDWTRDWLRANPYPLGVNYCSALECALRAYAWLWSLSLLDDYLAEVPNLRQALLEGIGLSCRHIENNLSYYFAPNTHLLGEAFALFACGAALPQHKHAARWRQLGSRILAEEADRQFHKDGMHRELSSCYHLYATDFYVQAALIARETGLVIDERIAATARQAVYRLSEMVPDDLVLPQFNDCDGGRLTWFCNQPLDAAPALYAAGQLWPDLSISRQLGPANGYHVWMAPVAGGPLHMLSSATGSATLKSRDLAMPAAGSAHSDRPRAMARPESGIVCYRNAAGDYLLFRCGPFGYMDCGHSHDAQTSFLLYFRGEPVIIDCGTGAYTQQLGMRNRFRGAAGKNVLLINGSGPSLPDGWFTWQQVTHGSLTAAERINGGFHCAGVYRGFSKQLGFSVQVTRLLTMLDLGVLVVIDQWESPQPVSGSLQLTLQPGLEVALEKRQLRKSHGRGRYHLLSCQVEHGEGSGSESNQPLPCKPLSMGIKAGDYSPDYGSLQQTSVLCFGPETSTTGRFITVLSRIGQPSIGDEPGTFVVSASDRRYLLQTSLAGPTVMLDETPCAASAAL